MFTFSPGSDTIDLAHEVSPFLFVVVINSITEKPLMGLLISFFVFHLILQLAEHLMHA